jgi:HSP20 family protein
VTTPLVAVIELPGIDREEIQAKDNVIRVAGRKSVNYPEQASAHRRERLWGEFDRTITVPMRIDPGAIKAEYNDGLLALFIPRAEHDKPRTIQIK